MKTKQFGWLMLIVGTTLVFVWLVIAPALGARAHETASVSAVTLDLSSAPIRQVKTVGLTRTTDITFTLAYTAYLPLVSNVRPLQPAGIYGQVTYQGTPIDGLEIQLLLWNHVGGGWTSSSGDTLYAATQAGGQYQFTAASSLGSDQKYTVAFKNTANDPRFLASWRSSSIYTYTAGQVLAGGNFEIAEMEYLSPADNANVGLPVTFQWQPRIGSSSDSYMLEIFKSNSSTPWFDTPRLGYVGNYTLNSLPAGFTTGEQYGWYVWIFGPDDSYGLTNQYGWVTFH